jgi:3-methyladenine DNA glycosylase AlkD
MIDALAEEIRSQIEQRTGRREPRPDRQFHKHDEYLTYGMSAKDFRSLIKDFRRPFLELTLYKRLKLAQALVKQSIGETGHVAIHLLAMSTKELTPEYYHHLNEMAAQLHSWSQVDHLCHEVIQPLLGAARLETLTLLEYWNRSRNRFKRRASVVAFTRQAGESGLFIEEVLLFCWNLAWDPEEIVQKGVGWALKDNMRAAPDRIIPFVKELRIHGAPSTVTLYAIRGLKGKERDAILAVKKRRPV